ncbi:MAG: ATP-dependent Clp protease proteolytic subunit [Bacteroidota bacterium]
MTDGTFGFQHPFSEEDEDFVGEGGVSLIGDQLHFYAPIEERSVLMLNRNLTAAAQRAMQVTSRFHSIDDYPPIQLNIHSFGGSIFAGFAGVTAIRNCPVPIHTHIEGAVASAGTFLSLAGDHRSIGKDSYILIHQISSGFWGTYEQWKDERLNMDKFMEHITNFYIENTEISEELLDDLLKRDLWLNAEEALALGFVDEILG